MLHADLAEHEAHALAHAGADAEQHALQRQPEREPVPVLRAAEDGNGDTRQGDGHGQPGAPGQRFAEQGPARDGGEEGRERHEELPETGADHDVGIEEAEVAENVAHQGREAHPEPGLAVGEGRVGVADGDPQQATEQDGGEDHAEEVRAHRADAAAGLIGEKGRGGPGHGDD